MNLKCEFCDFEAMGTSKDEVVKSMMDHMKEKHPERFRDDMKRELERKVQEE